MPLNYAAIATEFDTRIKNVARRAPAIAATTWRVQRILGDVLNSTNKWAKDGQYTPQGKRDKIRAELSQKTIREYTLAKAAVERHAAAMPSVRAEIEAKAFAKFAGDPMGSEIRAAVRPLNHGDKIKAAGDPRVLGAIVGTPDILHGVEPNAIQHLVTAYLEKEHPDALAKIAAREEALAVAQGSLEILEKAVTEAVAFEHPRALADFITDHGATPQDLETESKGGVPSGLPKISMDQSFDKIMSDALTGLAA
jgi:hypothetical protein